MAGIALPLEPVPEPRVRGRLLADEPLARLAGRGSQQAFAILYERHHQAIYRYCRSILHNEHDAQDALQSTMMRAFAAMRAHERDLAVKPWLFRIAHNEAVSILRRRRPEVELSARHERADELGVEGTLQLRERLAALVEDLQALPERQRATLLMHELSGLSIRQIAGALQMSPGAAKQTLFEARNSLHELSQGRSMHCESVREAISGKDGRVLRSRRIRAHLRACSDCREFRAGIATRKADLAAIAPPLPAAIASSLLGRLLAHAGSPSGSLAGAGSGAGAGAGATLGGHAVASLAGKGLAGMAVLAVASAGAVHLATSGGARHTGAGHPRISAPAVGAGAHPPSARSAPSGRQAGAAARSSSTSATAPQALGGAPTGGERPSGSGGGPQTQRQSTSADASHGGRGGAAATFGRSQGGRGSGLSRGASSSPHASPRHSSSPGMSGAHRFTHHKRAAPSGHHPSHSGQRRRTAPARHGASASKGRASPPGGTGTGVARLPSSGSPQAPAGEAQQARPNRTRG